MNFLPKPEIASPSFPACSAAPPGRILENILSPSIPVGPAAALPMPPGRGAALEPIPVSGGCPALLAAMGAALAPMAVIGGVSILAIGDGAVPAGPVCLVCPIAPPAGPICPICPGFVCPGPSPTPCPAAVGCCCAPGVVPTPACPGLEADVCAWFCSWALCPWVPSA